MKMNQQIQHAIQLYILQKETIGELSERLNVAFSTIINWRDGQVKEIRTNHWRELKPLLMPFMKENQQETNNSEAYKLLTNMSKEFARLAELLTK